MGISGNQASLFEGFPNEEIDPNSAMFQTLRLITKTVDGQDWHCYDLHPLRKELNAGRLIVKK